MAIIHKTPTLLDIRALTIMGLSAKPNSTNPIGQFGTGLKYAIAVLVRMGARLTIFVDKDRYTFAKKPMDFRGERRELINMRHFAEGRNRSSNTDLPFTTEYGRNWHPWMAFRELEANTRDEHGETIHGGSEDPHEGHTVIIVDHPDYDAAWTGRDDTFLPDGLSVAVAGEGLQVLEGINKSLYYRAMRASDLAKPTLHTYNILNKSVEITEDRTIKHDWSARNLLANYVCTSDDETFIESVITAAEEYWEHDLAYPEHVSPSVAFCAVMNRNTKGVSTNASRYYDVHDSRKIVHETPAGLLDSHKRPWRVVGSQMLDADNKVVFEAPYSYQIGNKGTRWGLIAKEILERLNFDLKPLPVVDAGDSFGEAVDAALQDIAEEDGRSYSVADALLGVMDVTGEQFPAKLSDHLIDDNEPLPPVMPEAAPELPNDDMSF